MVTHTFRLGSTKNGLTLFSVESETESGCCGTYRFKLDADGLDNLRKVLSAKPTESNDTFEGHSREAISYDMTRLENLLSNLARDVGKQTLKTDVMDQQLTKMKQEIMELQNAPPTELQFRRSYTYGERITCLEGDMKILKRGYNIYGKSYPEAVKGLEAQLKSLEHMFQTTVGPATDKATTAAMKVERFDASIKILEEKVKELVDWTHLEEVKTGEDDPDYS